MSRVVLNLPKEVVKLTGSEVKRWINRTDGSLVQLGNTWYSESLYEWLATYISSKVLNSDGAVRLSVTYTDEDGVVQSTSAWVSDWGASTAMSSATGEVLETEDGGELQWSVSDGRVWLYATGVLNGAQGVSSLRLDIKPGYTEGDTLEEYITAIETALAAVTTWAAPLQSVPLGSSMVWTFTIEGEGVLETLTEGVYSSVYDCYLYDAPLSEALVEGSVVLLTLTYEDSDGSTVVDEMEIEWPDVSSGENYFGETAGGVSIGFYHGAWAIGVECTQVVVALVGGEFTYSVDWDDLSSEHELTDGLSWRYANGVLYFPDCSLLYDYETVTLSIAVVTQLPSYADYVEFEGEDGETWIALTVIADEDSYRYRALMEEPQLVLNFSLPYYVDFPIGTYCDVGADDDSLQRFYLNYSHNLTKQAVRNIEYTLEMGDQTSHLSLYKFRDMTAGNEGRLKWSACSRPHEYLEYIVDNLNSRDGDDVWAVGDCITTDDDGDEIYEETIEFDHVTILEALQSIADTFETEWEVSEDADTGKWLVSLHKVEYNKGDGVALSYGRGNGFVSGVGRTTETDYMPLKRLYVQGGEDNIDRSTYAQEGYEHENGSQYLLLPPNTVIRYDGEYFDDESEFEDTYARDYKTDAQGFYIERSDTEVDAIKEDSLDCSEIYPRRVGTVGGVVSDGGTWKDDDGESHTYYDFVDLTLPTDEDDEDYIDYNELIIDGETMTVQFQSGMLAGREFEVEEVEIISGAWTDDDGNEVTSAWCFRLVPEEQDGVLMPSDEDGDWLPAEGDTYAVFNVSMPQAYISAAEREMLKEAVEYMYEHETQKFTFTGELQSKWARENWSGISAKLIVGGYVDFSDTQFAPGGVEIRITGIKDYLHKPYAPELELSNEASYNGNVVSYQLKKIDRAGVKIDAATRSLSAAIKRATSSKSRSS